MVIGNSHQYVLLFLIGQPAPSKLSVMFYFLQSKKSRDNKSKGKP